MSIKVFTNGESSGFSVRAIDGFDYRLMIEFGQAGWIALDAEDAIELGKALTINGRKMMEAANADVAA